MPVLSVHAPCLLISQRVWGANPIPKLERSVRAAEQLGAQTVVVHPPFRWQRRYAEGFSDSGRRAQGVQRCDGGVENMFRSAPTGSSVPARHRSSGCVSGVARPGPAFRRSHRPMTRSTAITPTTRSTVAHRDIWHRRARHGPPDGGWTRAPAPVRRQRRLHRRTPGAATRRSARRMPSKVAGVFA